MTRELTLERRKVVEAGKRADDLRREIKSLRESTQVDVKRKILNRPILHPTMNQMGMKKVTQIPKDNFQE